MAKAKKKAPPKAQLLFRFKVTLIDSTPPIWRRIVVPNGTLDDLHEHIQTAMGWTNSHLHRFEIAKRIYGERELLCDGWPGDEHIIESRTTRLTSLFSQAPAPFRFGYLYDFGDDWKHEVVYEGTEARAARQKYPLCLEGARACPPEDVGGVWGYEEFLQALRDPKHPEHKNYLEWTGGSFDAEAFDAAAATIAMRQGLPDWRVEDAY